MSGEVPPMFWFLFWLGLSVGILSFGFFMAILIHRGNMKALEVLKTYAERGMEPPPTVVETLTRQIGGAEATQGGRDVGRKAGNFTGLVVSACVAGAIGWWRLQAGGPLWVVYLFAVIALFWGVRAITFLLSALTTNEK